MKLHIYSYVATIILIVLASAGCLEPAGTDQIANVTLEPTPEPCETCTVPEDFCGPPGVCQIGRASCRERVFGYV